MGAQPRRLTGTLAGLMLVAAALPGQEVKPPQDDSPRDPTGPLARPLSEPRPTARAGTPGGPKPRAPAMTIVYDDGVATATPSVSSHCYGNQFNTGSGMAVVSFSVTKLTFFIVTGAGTDGVFLSVFGAVAGTGAPVLSSAPVPLNNGSGAFNTHTFATPIVGAGSFLAGVWYVAGDSVGLGTGTVGGQGHHGMLINDILGTGFATLPGLNALVRAARATIPVELMNFSVTDE